MITYMKSDLWKAAILSVLITKGKERVRLQLRGQDEKRAK
jgi:hypothetical protein